MNDESSLYQDLERLQGEVNGLRLVCEALVRFLLVDSVLEHSEQEGAFLAHLRSILERFNPPGSMSDIYPRNTAMINVLREFSDTLMRKQVSSATCMFLLRQRHTHTR